MYHTRILLALVLTSTTILPVVAQSTSDEPFFRLNLNGSTFSGAPPADTNDDDDDNGGGGGPDDNDDDGAPTTPSLRYDPQTTMPGLTVTASPIFPQGVTPTLFVQQTYPNGMTVAEDGTITWVTDATRTGPQVAEIRMYTKPSPQVNEDPYVVGRFVLDIDGDIDLIIAPDNVDIALGFPTNEPISISATIPSMDMTGWEWDVRSTGLANGYDFTSSQNTITLDPDGMTAQNRETGSYGMQLMISHYDDNSGDYQEIYSNILDVDVLGLPKLAWADDASAPNHRIFNYEGNAYIWVKSGSPVSISPQFVNGAAGIPSTWPSWIDDKLDGFQNADDLYSGLAFSSSGVLEGTTSTIAVENETDIYFVVPTASNDGRNGYTALYIIPTNDLPTSNPFLPVDTDGDDVFDNEDPYPLDPTKWGENGKDDDGDGVNNEDDAAMNDPTYWGSISPSYYWTATENAEVRVLNCLNVPGDAIQYAYDENGEYVLDEFDNPQCVMTIPDGERYTTHEAAYQALRDEGQHCSDMVVPQYGIDWFGSGQRFPC